MTNSRSTTFENPKFISIFIHSSYYVNSSNLFMYFFIITMITIIVIIYICVIGEPAYSKPGYHYEVKVHTGV